MPAAEDYYARLRVSPEAEAGAIRAAYRELMRRYHPDVNASEDAVAMAKAINEAYACLRDADRRAAYDWRRTVPQSSRPSPYSPGRPPRPTRPRPVWTGPAPRPERPQPWFKPTLGKAIGLGCAALLTSITFTLTSATPPADPTMAKPAREVHLRLPPQGDRAKSDRDRQIFSTSLSSPRT